MRACLCDSGIFDCPRMDKPDFHAAARSGSLAQLPAHLLTVENLTAGNSSGNTPVHIAAKYGTLDQLPASLLTAAVLLIKNDAGFTPLHLAAREGTLDRFPATLLAPEY